MYNPQAEANGKFFKVLEFLDWELDGEVKTRFLPLSITPEFL